MKWTAEQAMAALKLSDKEKVALLKNCKVSEERLVDIMGDNMCQVFEELAEKLF